MTEKTLRRKNQKKAKRRRYSRCSLCGGFALTHMEHDIPVKRCRDCGREREMEVTYGRQGGGTADAYPAPA